MNDPSVEPVHPRPTLTTDAVTPADRRRVALVNTLFAPFDAGGAARSVRELARDLVAAGHSVQVHTLAPRGYRPAAETIDGIEVVRLRSDASFGPFAQEGDAITRLGKVAWHLTENNRAPVARHLGRAFDRFQPDLVHTNNLAGFGAAAWEVCRTVPLVHTMRDYYLLCSRSQLYRRDAICDRQCRACSWLKAPLPALDRRPDVFVGVSHDIVARHRALGAIREHERTEVVHNWPSVRRSGEPPGSGSGTALRFGLLGKVHQTKGTWTVVEAFAGLPEELRRASRLLIAGPASIEDRTRLLTACERVAGIEYLGQQVDPVRFFEAVDVALVPSQWHEPFGRVAAEARLLGAAVIASRAGGLPEAVAAFGGGRLLDAFDRPAAWTAALADAIRQPPARVTGPPAPSPVGDRYREIYRLADVSRGRGAGPAQRR